MDTQWIKRAWFAVLHFDWWPLARPILLAAWITLPLSSCTAPSSEPAISAYTLSAQAEYPKALQFARDWQEDVYLVSALAGFSLDPADPLLCMFHFRSTSAPLTLLSLTQDTETGSFEGEWISLAHASPASLGTEIQEQDWPIDSIEALEIAQLHGGAEFFAGRSSHLLSLSLTLEKRRRLGGQVTVWEAVYHDLTATQGFRVFVDASSGDVIKAADIQPKG